MILAVDQGTSSTKAVLVDPAGRIAARGAAPVGSAYPRPGWVEQDAEEIWRSVPAAVERCLAQAPGAAPQALALTNQRESAVLWRRDTGAPAGPVIGWQDRRTAPDCERLREDEALVRARTGLALNPMFSATKLRRLLERAPAAELCAGTLDAYLVFRLTGGAVFAAGAWDAVTPPPSRAFAPQIDATARAERRAAWSAAVARSRPRVGGIRSEALR